MAGDDASLQTLLLVLWSVLVAQAELCDRQALVQVTSFKYQAVCGTIIVSTGIAQPIL